MNTRDLFPRLHTTPDLLARCSEEVKALWRTPVAAMQHVLAYLRPLPPPLVQAWLQNEAGHILLTAQEHGYTRGPVPWRHGPLLGVAQINLNTSVHEPRHFLFPVGLLLADILQWQTPSSLLKQASAFAAAVERGFAAGYSPYPAAHQNPDTYLAAGIAAYLVDRRQLNVEDPALEKLLRATIFRASSYRSPTPSTPQL